MRFEPIEPRENTRAFNLPPDPDKAEAFIKQIMSPYQFIMLMGLSCTGKSTFLDSYRGKKGWSLTKWNRDNICDMIFQDGRRVEKYYGYINKFEGQLFPALATRERHQVVVEGWNTLPSGRMRYMNYLPPGFGHTACFVFDGPIEEIIKRNQTRATLDLSDKELPIFLRDKHESIVWPKFDEGWNDIFYINTFGGLGEEYMKERTV